MEDLGNLTNTTEQPDDQLSLAETPMVYKAHAAVGAVIFVEGF